MKVFITVSVYGGVLNDIKAFRTYQDTLNEFENHYPDCGGYKVFKEWFEYSHGCTTVEHDEAILLESAHQGLKRCNPDRNEYHIFECEVQS